MKKKTLVLFALVLTVSLVAQAVTHSVALTWTDAQNPTGTTYNVYRATGLCSGSPSYTKIASAVTVLNYTDTTVVPGNYCYYVTAVVSGVESAPSNTVQPTVPAFAPTSLGATVQ